MEYAEEALLTEKPYHFCKVIRNNNFSERDIKDLVKISLDIRDYDSLWYLVEIFDFDDYILELCQSNKYPFPCQVLERKGNYLSSLEESLIKNNLPLAIYTLDIINNKNDKEIINHSNSILKKYKSSNIVNKLNNLIKIKY